MQLFPAIDLRGGKVVRLTQGDYDRMTVYGAVRAGKVYGTQFHPEKSGGAGLRLLKAFSEL